MIKNYENCNLGLVAHSVGSRLHHLGLVAHSFVSWCLSFLYEIVLSYLEIIFLEKMV